MRSRWLTWILVLVFAAAMLALWPWMRPAFTGGVRAAADLLARMGWWGPLVVILLQVIQAVVSPLPSWPVTVAAGALYGPALATLYSLVGGMLGAAFNFILARRLGASLVRAKLGERWLDRAGKLGPLHFLVLSMLGRLIPIASFDAVAYVAGISRISLTLFLGVAALGQAPAFLAYAYFGSDLAAAQSAGMRGSVLVLLFAVLIAGGRQLWRRFSA